MINKKRLWNNLICLGEIGRDKEGGLTRTSFTEEERKAKDLVAGFMLDAGLQVREDAVGNLIGRKEGLDLNSPVVLIGSHLDTVIQGGMFDGALGVLAAVEVLHTMKENGVITKHPIEIISFADEEGSRFNFGMLGSRALTGRLEESDLYRKDSSGVTMFTAMEEYGLNPSEYSKVVRAPGSVKVFIELHAEQGNVLENNSCSVGIVTGIAAPLWLKIVLTGNAGHAGSTSMNLRKDSLVAATKIITLISREVASTDSTVCTVGKIDVSPGGINIIPGKTEFTLDLRSNSEKTRNDIENKIREKSVKLCKRMGISIDIETLQRISPVSCSEDIQQVIKGSCERLNIDCIYMPSGAAHDAMQMSELCPIGIIFVRSKDGESHNPKEWSRPQDCADGANVLYNTVLTFSKVISNSETSSNVSGSEGGE